MLFRSRVSVVSVTAPRPKLDPTSKPVASKRLCPPPEILRASPPSPEFEFVFILEPSLNARAIGTIGGRQERQPRHKTNRAPGIFRDASIGFNGRWPGRMNPRLAAGVVGEFRRRLRGRRATTMFNAGKPDAR